MPRPKNIWSIDCRPVTKFAIEMFTSRRAKNRMKPHRDITYFLVSSGACYGVSMADDLLFLPMEPFGFLMMTIINVMNSSAELSGVP